MSVDFAQDLPHDVQLTNNVGDSSVCIKHGNTIGTTFAISGIVLQEHFPAHCSITLQWAQG